MAKTKVELNALKEEFETLNKKLVELTEEELAQVTGGKTLPIQANIPWGQYVLPAPTSFDLAAGLGKSYVATTRKTDDVSIAINQAEAK